MGIDENKALVRRFLEEVYARGNLEVADELVAPDYASHNHLGMEVVGPSGIKAAARLQRAAFPDQESLIDELIAEGDMVVVRGRDRGTHSGVDFAGIPARGQRFEVTWIDIFRIEEGKLREAWLEMDVSWFRRQLLGKEAHTGDVDT